jgi:putative oxidoreductase
VHPRLKQLRVDSRGLDADRRTPNEYIATMLGIETLMAISRRIARPLLASIFIAGGLDALRNPGAKVKAAEAVVGPLSDGVSSIPNDPETLVRLNGAIQVVSGSLLAVGRFRRLASVALICSIIPTTYAGHRFWEETDDATRAQQRMHFFKNLGLLGGLILAALDTEGEPSLSWRARRRGRQVEAALAIGRAATASNTRRSASTVARVSKRQARQARRFGHLAQDLAVDALHHNVTSEIPRQIGSTAASLATAAGALGLNVARELKPAIEAATNSGVDVAKPLLATGADVAGGVISGISEHLPSR